MSNLNRRSMVAPSCAIALMAGGLLVAGPADAQNRWADGITDLIERETAEKAPSADVRPGARADTDPRAGDKTYEQAKRLMQA
ncbi:MAG: hypothetical protein AAFV26_10300, partial [Pseudomonadota bacterium]